MSAFIVSPFHINTLVSWAHEKTVWLKHDGSDYSFKEEPARLAGILYSANVVSVNERYNEDEPSGSFPFEMLSWSDIYAIDPVQIIKACDCLDYQSCEMESWNGSLAYELLQAIREEAIRCLPGMEDAKWELSEPEKTEE